MNAPTKFFFASLVIAVAITVTSCSAVRRLVEPRRDVCTAKFVQDSDTRLTLRVDSSTIFDGNFMPDDSWNQLHLEDGSIHTYEVYATDPRVYHKSGTFKVQMNRTHVYDGIEYNAVIRFGPNGVSVLDVIAPINPADDVR